MIDFEKIKPTVIQNFKGGKGEVETKMFQDETIKICKNRLKKGSSIGYHMHKGSSEIIYVLSGIATITLDGKTETLNAGQCHYCKEGHYHGVENKNEEDLILFCIVPTL